MYTSVAFFCTIDASWSRTGVNGPLEGFTQIWIDYTFVSKLLFRHQNFSRLHTYTVTASHTRIHTHTHTHLTA